MSLDLEKQRKLLDEMRVLHKTRADRLDADQRRVGQEIEADWEEQATQRENDEVVDRLDEMAHNELGQIDHALARLDAGTYEICEACEEPIGDARLQAVPETALCVRCAS